MDINRVLENLKYLKATDLNPGSAEEIKSEIVAATQIVGDDLPHYVVPRGFKGIPKLSDDEHLAAIYAIAGIGIMGFAERITLHHSDNVIIYEPVPGLAYLFLSQINLTEFFGKCRVHIFSDLDVFAKNLGDIYEWWKTINAWKSPPGARLYPDKVEAFHQHLIQNGLIGKVNLNTLNRLYFLWVRNELVNLHALRNRANAISCPGGMKNIPAVLVGAGPSLRHSLPALKEATRMDKILIIAASTTLRILIPEEIHPHFVIIIEGEKQAHFENMPNLDQMRLLAHLQTSPDHLEHPYKDRFWFNQETSPLAAAVSAIHPEIQPLKFSGNVVSSAFLLATFWGCAPIAFIGMDLAYQPGTKYMKGLEKKEEGPEEKRFYVVPGQDDRQLEAPPEFISYAHNLEAGIEQIRKINPEFQAVNASVGGRRIKGTIEMPLEDFVKRTSARNTPVSLLLKQFISSWPVLPADKVDTILQDHLKTYHRLETLLNKPVTSLQTSENLININELLKKLPEFNTGVTRLIPWVRHIRSRRNVSEADLSSLKTEVCQILDGFRHLPDNNLSNL